MVGLSGLAELAGVTTSYACRLVARGRLPAPCGADGGRRLWLVSECAGPAEEMRRARSARRALTLERRSRRGGQGLIEELLG
jgi:hypothetical protein